MSCGWWLNIKWNVKRAKRWPDSDLSSLFVHNNKSSEDFFFFSWNKTTSFYPLYAWQELNAHHALPWRTNVVRICTSTELYMHSGDFRHSLELTKLVNENGKTKTKCLAWASRDLLCSRVEEKNKNNTKSPPFAGFMSEMKSCICGLQLVMDYVCRIFKCLIWVNVAACLHKVGLNK